MALSALRNFSATRDPRGVVTVSLDVPGRAYNVFNEEVIAELQSLVNELEHDPTIRLVVFVSGKESGFLAGGDLREVCAVRSREAADQIVLVGQKLFDRIERLPMPTVAAIHGPCLGGGLEFALACRYRLARDDDRTQLGLPEVDLGLVPAWGGTQRLPELVGLGAALRMLLRAERISARQAARLGLVDGLWPAGRFAAGVEQSVADRLAGKPFRRGRLGVLARLRDGTRLGKEALLWAARRKIAPRRRDAPALAAMLAAVTQGVRQGREAGMARERELFPELLFSPQCRRQMRRFLEGKRAEKPAAWVDGLTIGAVLRQTARRFASREAMVFCQPGLRMTWAEFDRAVDRAARGLLALGFRPGDHFGVWSTNWPEVVILQFATARIGVVLVTINPAYRSAELEYALAQSEARGLALIQQHKSSDYFGMLRQLCPELDAFPPGWLRSARFPHLQHVLCLHGAASPRMLTWEELAEAGGAFPAAKLDQVERQLAAGDPINLQYTSGTTGPPKGALLSHRNLLMSAFFAGQGQGLDEHDRVCIPVPLYHCFGCVLGTLCAVVRGAAMIFPRESFDAATTLEAIASQRCTAIYGVPAMFIAELEHPSFPGTDRSSLRTGIMAGSPCPVELMKRVVREMGARQIIIRGGENIAPREIEELLYQHPKVEQVAVVGVPDLRFGEEILAAIKLRAGQSATEDEIRTFCRARLAHFKTPRYVKFTDTFPMTVTGKIQKYRIRQQAIEELGLHDAAAVETA